EARRQLRLQATISEGLLERGPEREDNERRTILTFPPPLTANAIPWGIAAAACILALGLLVRGPSSSPLEVRGDAEEETVMALLVNEAGAVFAEDRGPEAVRFGAGRYSLEEGAAHLRFSNGADLVLRAPVRFSIEDAFSLALSEGDVRAIVPPSAQGFTIATSGIHYEDLGTEFGLRVKGEESLLHVFDGRVDAKDPDSDRLLESVGRGESYRFDGERLAPGEGELALDRFLTPDSIGFLRWQAQREMLLADPSLIAWYSFDARKGEANTLPNEVEQEGIVSDGSIQGARWVSGRWPGKGALLFDRDEDYVELSVAGELEEFTVACWVKANRLDYALNAIFDSNEWNEGDVHFQLNRLGFAAVSGYTGREKPLEQLAPLPMGQWVHLVGVLSTKTRESSVYVNGELATRDSLAEGTILRPGVCRLGNWKWDGEWPSTPKRAFRGTMDEVAMWSRALSPDEIQELMREGRPAALWMAGG
ncbi:MAG: LamG-like jellyroll fold domain-containing protein, partial [Verrucomicrobiota bacterium]